MENSFKSAESVRNVNALVQKIDGLCKDIENALAFCFNRTGEQVAGHSISLTAKMDTDYVDSVVVAFHLMKRHLEKLKTALKSFGGTHDIDTIVSGLRTSADGIQQLLHSNLFFYNTFHLLSSEVQVLIDQVFEQVQTQEVEIARAA